MIIQPGKFPGSHERHLLRKAGNPLFGDLQLELTDSKLLDAQAKDHELLLDFVREFRALLQETTTLSANADSEVVLALKDRLDRAYETASAVADDQAESKAAIRKLLQLIMGAVRRGAGDDVQAQHELDQEEAAREAHFQLLESALVADLLNPESVISARELVPVLLSSAQADTRLALQLFDFKQLEALFSQSGQLLAQQFGSGQPPEQAVQNLALMEAYRQLLRQAQDRLN